MQWIMTHSLMQPYWRTLWSWGKDVPISERSNYLSATRKENWSCQNDVKLGKELSNSFLKTWKNSESIIFKEEKCCEKLYIFSYTCKGSLNCLKYDRLGHDWWRYFWLQLGGIGLFSAGLLCRTSKQVNLSWFSWWQHIGTVNWKDLQHYIFHTLLRL